MQSPKKSPRDGLLSSKQAAHRVGCSVQTIHRWRSSGKLVGIRRGGRWFFKVEDLDRMFRVEVGENASLHERARAALQAIKKGSA